ncbi:response regulator transcription factor [Campylobacter sp. Cr9]|uniref:response regulator transcription factor n=1 Tax=unclassified Campylobacter TaxID=2593542 RepID=UPI001EFB5F87|nr:response regulator transcription factor [Campylobacter sp. RM5004]MBZ7985347.1 response regulator transcription factor [Campylobacter sp. Cr9]ULO00849.1 two-component system response regulator [Campylobacter sp. RM5004]
MINVMMIEDEVEYAGLITEFLAKFNIKVTNFSTPAEGLAADISQFDCLILDLTLPGMDGLEVCKEIRKKYDIPVIISSARGDTSDKVLGLGLGADDYLPKPYEPTELQARVSSLVRRYKKAILPPEEEVSTLFKVEHEKHEIYYDKKPLSLTPAEYDILSYLVKRHSYSVSREELASSCRSLREKDSKSLDVIIGRLRNKIGDSSKDPKHIFSVRGIGYKLIG